MGPFDMMNLMKNAKKMQEMMQDQQAKIAQITVRGEAGAGAVVVEMNGEHQVKAVTIDPEYTKEPVEVLQDLVAAAINNATQQIAKAQKDNLGKILGGSGLNGLGDLLK